MARAVLIIMAVAFFAGMAYAQIEFVGVDTLSAPGVTNTLRCVKFRDPLPRNHRWRRRNHLAYHRWKTKRGTSWESNPFDFPVNLWCVEWIPELDRWLIGGDEGDAGSNHRRLAPPISSFLLNPFPATSGYYLREIWYQESSGNIFLSLPNGMYYSHFSDSSWMTMTAGEWSTPGSGGWHFRGYCR